MNSFFRGFEKAAALRTDVGKTLLPPSLASAKKNYLQSIAKKKQKTMAAAAAPKMRMAG